MKFRFIALIFSALLVLTSCAESDELSEYRAVISANDAELAVAYIGYLDGGFSELGGQLERLGMTEHFPFLSELDERRFVGLAGGELYLIIPPEGASVEVRNWYIDESDGYTGHTDSAESALYSGGSEPIVLRCNVSEIMPNAAVIVTRNGESVTVNPFLSLRDSTLAINENIADITPYDLLGIEPETDD